MEPAASFLTVTSQWINSKTVSCDRGSFLSSRFSLWNLDSILSAVVYVDQVLSAKLWRLISSKSAVTDDGSFKADRSTMLFLVFPYLELRADGVAANRGWRGCGRDPPANLHGVRHGCVGG